MSQTVFGEPELKTISIRGLIKNLSIWRLRLPSFQRSFVWDDEDVKKFIESMVKGYPCGTILLWKPSDPDIDPFALDFIERNEPKIYPTEREEIYYVIDGQQRLTSLMLLIHGWKISRCGKILSRSPITINPSKIEPELFIDPNQKKGYDLYRGVRDRLFTDVEESRRLEKELGKEAYRRFMNVVDKILDYNIPIHIIKTSNESRDILGLMANIFIMVNRAGQRVTNMELLLSYTAGILDRALADRIRKIYDHVQKIFGEEVSITAFIRFVFSKPSLGLTQSEIDNVEKFKSKINEWGQQTIDNKSKLEELYESIDNAGESYMLSLTLVNKIFGKSALSLLPSSLSIIPVACYLHKERIKNLETLSEADLINIKKWLLLVNFNGYYSARTSTRLQRDIDTVYQNSSNSFPIADLIGNITRGRRSAAKLTYESIEEGRYRDILKRPLIAYLFLLYVALVDNNAENWKGTLIRECEFEKLAKAHIFPRSILSKKLLNANAYEEDERSLASSGINGMGNITFMDRDVNNSLKDELPSKYLPDYSEELRKQHFIPGSKYWDIKRFDEFTEQRTNMIIDFIRQRYNDIFSE